MKKNGLAVRNNSFLCLETACASFLNYLVIWLRVIHDVLMLAEFLRAKIFTDVIFHLRNYIIFPESAFLFVKINMELKIIVKVNNSRGKSLACLKGKSR